jgi:hypothetical protein
VWTQTTLDNFLQSRAYMTSGHHVTSTHLHVIQIRSCHPLLVNCLHVLLLATSHVFPNDRLADNSEVVQAQMAADGSKWNALSHRKLCYKQRAWRSSQVKDRWFQNTSEDYLFLEHIMKISARTTSYPPEASNSSQACHYSTQNPVLSLLIFLPITVHPAHASVQSQRQ